MREPTKGLMLAVAAYLIWGGMPAYVVLMRGIGALELIGWRILASIAVAALVVTWTRGWPAVIAAVRDRRALGILTVSGVVILGNWTVFAFAILTGHIVEASLGYFLNPILSVVLGVVVLRERLRPAQWVAVGISAVAVAVLIVGYASFPWIAIALAATFGTYGLLKHRVGRSVDAVTSFTIETVVTLPISMAMLIGSIAVLGPTILAVGPGAQWAVVGFGVITAVPLMLFSAAARRITLTTLGFTQYLAPILGFAFGVVVMHEPMPPERLAGFAIVWVALVVLTVDLVVADRSRRRALAAPTPAP